MTTEETELQFIRCPGCRSLVPAVAQRCRMCGYLLVKDGEQEQPESALDRMSRKPRVRQKTMSVSGEEVEELKRTVAEDRTGERFKEQEPEEVEEEEAPIYAEPEQEEPVPAAPFRLGAFSREAPMTAPETPRPTPAFRQEPVTRGTDPSFWRSEREESEEQEEPKPQRSRWLEEAAKEDHEQFELENTEAEFDDEDGEEDDADVDSPPETHAAAPGHTPGEGGKRRKRRRKKKKGPQLAQADQVPAPHAPVEGVPGRSHFDPPRAAQPPRPEHRAPEPFRAEHRAPEPARVEPVRFEPKGRAEPLRPAAGLERQNVAPHEEPPRREEKPRPAEDLMKAVEEELNVRPAQDPTPSADEPIPADPAPVRQGLERPDEKHQPDPVKEPQESRPAPQPQVAAATAVASEGETAKEQIKEQAMNHSPETITNASAARQSVAPAVQADINAALTGWFVHFSGSPHGLSQELRTGRYFVSGQKLKNTDLVVNHASVSTPHCIIQTSPDTGLRIQDLMSEGGTFVRRAGESEYQRYSDAVDIHHGDWLRIGSYEVMVCLLPKGGR